MTCLVLLPGMDGTGEFFSGFMAELPGTIKAIAVKYPRKEPLRYEQLEGMVRRQLPVDEPYVLLGESFSGPLAITIAASKPRHLAGLVLCCSFVTNPLPALSWLKPLVAVMPWLMSAKWASPMLLAGHATPALRTQLEDVLATLPPEVVRTRAREVAVVNVTGPLARVSVPLLYLRATRDRLVPKSASEAICRIAPHTLVAAIDGPHMLLQTRPAEAAVIISKFMQSL